MIFTQEVPLMQKWFSGRSYILLNWNLKMVFFEVKGNRRIQRKISHHSKVNSHMATSNQTQTSLVGAECNYYYAIPAPCHFIINYFISN